MTTGTCDPVRLDGKVALVVGVGPGLGDDIATTLAARGATVALGARSADHLHDVAHRIDQAGGNCGVAPGDVSNPDEAARMVAETADRFGRLDIVVHNARARVPYRPFAEDDLGAWDLSYRVNVLGAAAVTQAAIPHLRSAGGGSIVFVGTMLTRKPLPTMGAYASSKGALLTMAATLAAELGPANIRVNTVVPGWMDGPSLREWFGRAAERAGTTAEHEYDVAARRAALGRLPTSMDCAQAVLFFASDMSAAITGQTLDVNAGEVFA